MQDMHAFLNTCRVLKGEDHTHTSMGYPMGMFYISYDKTDEFMKLYAQQVDSGSKIHLTEKHRNISPVLIDLDFRYKKQSTEVSRVYTLGHLKSFLTEYTKVLMDYIETTEEPKIYIMEKPSPRYDVDKDIIKDGVHIIISNIVTTPSVQFHVREKTLQFIDSSFTDCQFINSAADIFDEAVISKNNWLMYGSSKPSSVPYKISNVFTFNKNSNSLEEISESSTDHKGVSPTFALVTEMSIRNKLKKTDIKNDKLDEITNIEINLMENERKKIATAAATQITTNRSVLHVEEIQMIKSFVDTLSSKRSENYEDWIKVGWCLRNIDNDLLQDWITFSKKSDKYQDGECEKVWNQMREGGLGIKTLHMWVKNDDPEEYSALMKSSGRELLIASCVTGTDWDIGLVIKHYYQHMFRCSSIRNNEWFYFANHRWNKCEDAYMLRNDISTKVFDMYEAYVKEWEKDKIDSGADKSTYEQESKTKRTLVKNMKNTNFKTKMIKTATDMFHELAMAEGFLDQLDANKQFLCFKNGLYDFENCEFREGRPDDYVSFSTNIDYVEYDETEPVFKEINTFLAQVQPDKQKREYILKMLAKSLDGSNREEKVYFWTGEGGNGKSKLYSLLENCMGDYAANLSVSFLTSKRAASNSASPELMKTKGKRLVVFQEPEPEEKINVGLMKELSGGDRISTRGLYKDTEYFTPQFQMIFICNQLPTLPADDGGTWRRVRKITFDSKFVEDPNPKDPNEFKIDNELDKKWPEWKVPFMSLLIHYYKKYKNEPNKEPQNVIDATKEYQNGNDNYIDFIDQHISVDPDSEIEIAAMFDEFKEYCSVWNKSRLILKKESLQKSVEMRFGKPKKSRTTIIWKGLKLSLTSSAKKNNEIVAVNDDIDD